MVFHLGCMCSLQDQGFCDMESEVKTLHGNYTWNETEVGQNSSSPCEIGEETGIEDGMGRVTRECKEPLMWEEYYGGYCTTEITHRLRILANVSELVVSYNAWISML